MRRIAPVLPMSPPVLLLAAKQCGQCLMSPGRIVSGERAAGIIRECRSAGTHFQCHKGSMAGLNLHCRGFHDRFSSRAYVFAQAIGVEVVEVDPEAIELPETYQTESPADD